MRVYDWAMLWVVHGYSVVPVTFRSKKQIKVKITDYHDKQPSTDELWRWFGGGNMHNYAVVMRNGLTVFDFDDIKSWYEWQWWSFDQPSGSPAEILRDNALCVKTSRGFHIWFKLKEKVHSCHVNGIDIKCASVVLGPGSTHPSGSPYRATNSFNIPTIETLESILPPEWYEKLQNQPEPEISGSARAKMPTLSDDPFEIATRAIVYDDGASLVQQVKERHKIETLLSNVMKGTNGYLMASCPFPSHGEDRNPSFWIDTKRGIGNCNKCQFSAPLDVINLYAKMNGISNKDALYKLANV